jgi:hypothetical protein
MRLALTSAALAAAIGLGTLAGGALRAEEPPAAKPELRKGIAALGWLAGSWRGTDGRSVWETCYSTPEGGQIVSASKEMRGGRAVMFDFERFRTTSDAVVLTPYPFGKKSVDFTLTGHDPAVKKAVFVNEEHDFPKRFTYAIDAEGRLTIRLEGEQRGKPVKLELKLEKRR